MIALGYSVRNNNFNPNRGESNYFVRHAFSSRKLLGKFTSSLMLTHSGKITTWGNHFVIPTSLARAISTSPESAPVRVYINSDKEKKLIISDNNAKSGVYRWVHIESGKSYVGSSTNLSTRFRHYFNQKYLSDKKRGESIICKALLKYGYVGFRLEILEYCPKEMAIEREQFYIDKHNPEFNILKIAGSNLGFKFSAASRKLLSELAKARFSTEEGRLRMKGRVVSDVTKAKISSALKDREVSEETREAKRLALLGRKLSGDRIKNMAISNSSKAGKPLILISERSETASTLEFPSISEVSKFLETNREQVRKYLDSNTSLKGYLIISKPTGDATPSDESNGAAIIKKYIQPVVVSNQ